jgi:hypothetical protein
VFRHICDHGSENGPRWRKIRFWVFAIFSVVLHCCISIKLVWKSYGNIWSTLWDMAILYISLTINLGFVFNWIFILFLGFQQCSIPHSQIYNFLLFDLGYWYLAFLFINLFEFFVHGYFLPVTLTFDTKVKLMTVKRKYCILLITFVHWVYSLNVWYVARLSQVYLPYMLLYVTLAFYFKDKLIII